jgi:hypothetical protein
VTKGARSLRGRSLPKTPRAGSGAVTKRADGSFEANFRAETQAASNRRASSLSAQKAERGTDVRASVASGRTRIKWLISISERPFDGIVGELPTWMPSPLEYEFNSLRRQLLQDNRSLRKLRQQIREIRKGAVASNQDERLLRLPSLSPEHQRDLLALIYIQDIASLGEKDGIKAYLGQSSTEVARGVFLSERLREIARQPRQRNSPLRTAIKDQLQREPTKSSKLVRRDLPPHLVADRTDRALDVAISEERRKIKIRLSR